MRNACAQTVFATDAVRGRPGAPAATPLHWAEVEDGGLNPRRFTLRTLARELEGRGDPWAGMARHRRGLPDRLPEWERQPPRSGGLPGTYPGGCPAPRCRVNGQPPG